MKISVFRFLSFATILGSLNACVKDEIPVLPPPPGNLIQAQAPIGNDYGNQVYFSLETGTVIHSHLKTIWDLAFSSTDSTHTIWLNSSKAMSAAFYVNANFENTNQAQQFELKQQYDNPNAHPDSVALFNWQDKKGVYVINLGFGIQGEPLGFRKIQLLDANHKRYQIRIATLDNAIDTIIEVIKSKQHTQVFLSLINLKQVDAAPPKNLWDLQFTQHLHFFYAPDFIAYLVTGCLLNAYNTSASLVIENNFETFNLEQAELVTLSYHANAIGYDWKNFTGREFIILPNRFYIIKTQKGFFYKLRFIDFYDSQGNRGGNRFEFQRL